MCAVRRFLALLKPSAARRSREMQGGLSAVFHQDERRSEKSRHAARMTFSMYLGIPLKARPLNLSKGARRPPFAPSTGSGLRARTAAYAEFDA